MTDLSGRNSPQSTDAACVHGHMYCEGGESCRARQRAAADGLVIGLTGKPMKLCDGMDGPFPCSKSMGHPGPHYFYNP